MKTIKRFFLLVILLAIGGGVLYSFSPSVKQKVDVLWAGWFPPDSTGIGVDSAGTSEAVAGKRAGYGNKGWTNPYAKLDAHAEKTPASKAKDIATLAAYLVKPAKSEMEKVRVIFRWVTVNISYDDDAYNANSYGATDAEAVLQSRKSVCQGFAEVMKALCVEAGLEAEVVSGYSKGYSYSPGNKFDKTNHAWSAVKVDGAWRLFDATWAEGSGATKNGKLVSTKKFDDYWFDVDPHGMIFNHLPEAPQWQLIDRNLSLAEYERLPYLQGSFFKYGFDGKNTFEKAISGEVKTFVETYSLDGRIMLKSAPSQKVLAAGEKVQFEVTSPDFDEMALVNNGEWTKIKPKGDVFKGELTPNAGSLSVNFKPKGSKGNSYSTLLKYDVKTRKNKVVKRPA